MSSLACKLQALLGGGEGKGRSLFPSLSPTPRESLLAGYIRIGIRILSTALTNANARTLNLFSTEECLFRHHTCTCIPSDFMYCWIACDVMVTMLVVKNSCLSLLWVLNFILMQIAKIICIVSTTNMAALSRGFSLWKFSSKRRSFVGKEDVGR